jgi:hypothetical protein
MKNKLIVLLSALTALVVAVPARAGDKSQIESHYNSYYTAAKAVIDMAITKQVDAAKVEHLVNSMIPHAIWMAQEYAKARPKGDKFIKHYIENLDGIRQLTFKEIESEWHDMGIFAKPGHEVGLDVKAEENEHFTDPAHAIIQPIMVLKAAQAYAAGRKDEDLKAMKEEMEESLEQAGKAEAVLLKT